MGSACASDLSTNNVSRTIFCCDNLKSTDFKSDAVFPIFLSQTQHECCLFVVSSSAFNLCLCWDFLSQLHSERAALYVGNPVLAVQS